MKKCNVFIIICLVVTGTLLTSAVTWGLEGAEGRHNGWIVQEIELLADGLVYDPDADLIYASLGMTDTVITIHPTTGQIGTLIANIEEPGKLTISDDNQYLYVAKNGGNYILQYDLNNNSTIREFFLGREGNNDYYVEDMVVMPTQPNTLAVSRMNLPYSPRHEGVGIYKDGNLLPNQTPDHTGSNVIEASSISRLYGYNNETTEFGFRTMTVDDAGVTIINVNNNLIHGFYVDIEYDSGNGLLYTTSGLAIDPVSQTIVNSYGLNGLIEPVSDIDKIFFFNDSGGNFSILDLDDYSFLESFQIPFAGESAYDLIYADNYRLAFYTDHIFYNTGGIYLIQPTHLFDLSPNHLQGSDFPNSTVTYAVTLTNTGNLPDSYTIDVIPGNWPVSTPATVGPLGPGEDLILEFTVYIPEGVTGGISDISTVKITSQEVTSMVQEIEITTFAIELPKNYLPILISNQ